MTRYRKLTEEGLDRNPWRIRCVTGCGIVVRQTKYANDNGVDDDDDNDDDDDDDT
jgi:hypothetical protein